jgi:excisionase family DNA binding protein
MADAALRPRDAQRELAAQTDSDRWLSPADAAERVGVHRRTIYRALAAGTLAGGQLAAGSGACRWRIRAGEVDRWAGARTGRFDTPPERTAPKPRRLAATSLSSSYRARAKEQR